MLLWDVSAAQGGGAAARAAVRGVPIGTPVIPLLSRCPRPVPSRTGPLAPAPPPQPPTKS